MRPLNELARISGEVSKRNRVEIEEKISQSTAILSNYIDDEEILLSLNFTNFINGVLPQLSPYDERYLPPDVRLVNVPHELQEKLMQERSYDLIRWNLPEQFLHRLQISYEPFKQPKPGESRVMDRIKADGIVVSFDDLRIDPPEPQSNRQSRSNVNNGIELNIMGQGRIPFVLGSVPDVGSFLSYVTMAQSNGMIFISRDKMMSDINHQAKLAGNVVDFLKNVELPKELTPTEDELDLFLSLTGFRGNRSKALEEYFKTLRKSWIGNVGAAIEASGKGVERTVALYNTGCRLFRIYSPEGGKEIIDTIETLKGEYSNDIQLVAGQIMDLGTALRAEDAGADALFIGVAGGSQCTTSVNADIPVKTPNLLYELRGRVKIPVGIEGGGVGTHIMTAFALGASFVSKPGEIGVSWEGAGGQFMFSDKEGNFYIPYGGEASISAKWWKDSVDDISRPKFVEGETGVRQIPLDRMSQTGNIKRLRDQLSVGLVFQRAGSIPELHERNCDNVVQVSEAASKLSQAYGS